MWLYWRVAATVVTINAARDVRPPYTSQIKTSIHNTLRTPQDAISLKEYCSTFGSAFKAELFEWTALNIITIYYKHLNICSGSELAEKSFSRKCKSYSGDAADGGSEPPHVATGWRLARWLAHYQTFLNVWHSKVQFRAPILELRAHSGCCGQ